MKIVVALLGLALAMTGSAHADDLENALKNAQETFETAFPQLPGTTLGVDTAAYRDALLLQRFDSALYGRQIAVKLVRRTDSAGQCARFAAYVRPAPDEGAVTLNLCPQFFTPGADALRELTILHEMVHVVAGTDECQAMAYAARVEHLATGQFTPVAAYWQANGCPGSAYALPR